MGCCELLLCCGAGPCVRPAPHPGGTLSGRWARPTTRSRRRTLCGCTSHGAWAAGDPPCGAHAVKSCRGRGATTLYHHPARNPAHVMVPPPCSPLALRRADRYTACHLVLCPPPPHRHHPQDRERLSNRRGEPRAVAAVRAHPGHAVPSGRAAHSVRGQQQRGVHPGQQHRRVGVGGVPVAERGPAAAGGAVGARRRPPAAHRGAAGGHSQRQRRPAHALCVPYSGVFW